MFVGQQRLLHTCAPTTVAISGTCGAQIPVPPLVPRPSLRHPSLRTIWVYRADDERTLLTCARALVLHRWLANSGACCKPCSRRRRKKEENEREKCRSTRRCRRRRRGSAAWLCCCSCWRVSYIRRRHYIVFIYYCLRVSILLRRCLGRIGRRMCRRSTSLW